MSSNLDPALNRLHRCIAIMYNLSRRPETPRTQKIYEMCLETMVHTSAAYPTITNVVKLYMTAKTSKEFAMNKDLHPRAHTSSYVSCIESITDEMHCFFSILHMEVFFSKCF